MDEVTIRFINGKNRIVCDEDVTSCEPHPDDFEIPEDTPCLDEPWWRHP